MSKAQDPLYYSQLECPVCKNINDFANIRSGSYSESGRDADFCPTGRVWQNPIYQKFDPLLYFMATCQKCFYTREFNNVYKNWKSDTAFKTYRQKAIQEKHLAEYVKDDGLIKFLGLHLSENDKPFESAILKFLLGIFDEKLQARPSNLDIGRFFLRIGWLYRGRGDSFGVEGVSQARLIFGLRGAAMNVNQMVPGYGERVKNLKNQIQREFPLIFENPDEAARYNQRIENIMAVISNSIAPLVKAGSELLAVFNEAQSSLGVDSGTESDRFFNYPDFNDFLLKAKQLWDEVPLSEQEALEKAAEYYRKAYETGGQIGQGIQQVQASYLIAELNRRTGNHADASQFFNQMIRMGQEIVNGKKADSSTINFTRKLLETAMDQARLNREQSEGAI